MLLRENEKLKNEQRSTRRSVNTHNMTSHGLLTGNKYKNPMNNVSSNYLINYFSYRIIKI